MPSLLAGNCQNGLAARATFVTFCVVGYSPKLCYNATMKQRHYWLRQSYKLLLIFLLVILSACTPNPKPAQESLNSLLQQADKLIQERRTSEAINQLERAARLYADAPSPLIKIGQIYVMQQRWLLAEDAFNRALARNLNDPLAMAGLAETKLNQGDTLRALELWRKAVDINSNLPGVYTGLGRTHLARFEFEAAEKAFLQQQTHRSDPEAQWFLAALTAPRDVSTANDYLLSIPLESSPDVLARRDYLLATLVPFTSETPPAETAKATGIALVQVGLWPLAAHALTQAAEQLDDFSPQEQAEILAFLGHGLGQAGRPAFDLLEQAKALNPNSALPLYFHGIYLRQQGALRAAEDLLTQAIALDPENAAIYVELALTLAEQGNFSSAEESYIIAGKLAEDNLQIQLARLHFYAGRGYKMVETGIPAAEEIISKNEDNAEAHDLLGWMLFLTGNTTEAESALRRAIELDPKLVSASYHLARYYNNNGQSSAALSEYQHVVDWDTSGIFRARALKEMQRLNNQP